MGIENIDERDDETRIAKQVLEKMQASAQGALLKEANITYIECPPSNYRPKLGRGNMRATCLTDHAFWRKRS